MDSLKQVTVTDELGDKLEHYRKEGKWNVLVPSTTIQTISSLFKPVVDIVKISPDPKDGEVYEVVSGSGNFSMRATALLKIGYAAGVLWNARGSGRTDDGSNPNIVQYRAEAAIRKEDGTFNLLNAEYLLDLEVLQEEIKQTYEKKAEKAAKEENWSAERKQRYIDESVARDMLQKRKFRLQLAETGAMDRVIRKILALKGTYKREELMRPFVVPKIVFNPDTADPQVRAMLLRQGIEATQILFGSGERASLIEHQPTVSSAPEPGPGPIEKEEIPIEVEAAPAEPAFETLNAEGKRQALEKLMARKGYAPSKLKKPLATFNDVQLGMFLEHLNGMPDAVEEVPFE